LRAVAPPPLRPAAFFCAVVPPWELELRELLEPDFFPPRLELPGEFAIRAARSLDIPLSFSFSYCFSFLTLGRLFGIRGPPWGAFGVCSPLHRVRNGKNPHVLGDLERRIRELALSLPEAYEDEPWGHPVFKVPENRMFASMSADDDAVHVTVKLTPEEREVALLLPYARTARYVGRYGWVTADVTDQDSLETALEWLRESYWLRAPAHLRDAAWGSEDG
jgi:predicted DNA-binding protein (MmcQ/YjbR family)